LCLIFYCAKSIIFVPRSFYNRIVLFLNKIYHNKRLPYNSIFFIESSLNFFYKCMLIEFAIRSLGNDIILRFFYFAPSRYIEGENVWAVKDAGDHISQIMFFCGHKEHCAKLNDEQAYKYEVFLHVFCQLFFSNLSIFLYNLSYCIYQDWIRKLIDNVSF